MNAMHNLIFCGDEGVCNLLGHFVVLLPKAKIRITLLQAVVNLNGTHSAAFQNHSVHANSNLFRALCCLLDYNILLAPHRA